MDNDVLAEEIAGENFDLPHFINLTISDGPVREKIVNLTVTHKNIMVYYHGYYILDGATSKRPELFYEYWQDFEKLLSHKNSYHRDIGLTLIANLTVVDEDKKFPSLFDEYFSRLYDEKFMTGCCCIRNAPKIAQSYPGYAERIVDKLLNHQKRTQYKEKQEACLQSDILDVVDILYQDLADKKKLDDYIIKNARSISPKTKKNARQLAGKYNITLPKK